MLAIAVLSIGVLAFLGLMRRGGFATWAALLVGMAACGGSPAEPAAGALAGVASFVALRLARS